MPPQKPRTPNIENFKQRFEKLEKDVRFLRDQMNSQDNWNSQVREWKDEEIMLSARSGEEARGVLKWTDRYNICLEMQGRTRIYSKGAIDWIEKVRQS